MRVVVTGASGFVGRALVELLRAQGATVIANDQASAAADLDGMILGDLGDAAVRAKMLAGGLDALIHLATVPGGAAEEDPNASRRINVDATYDLLLEAAAVRPGLRVVYTSSIAVFGDPLPPMVDDATPVNPRMVYGGHKAMMEQAVAMLSNRGQIDGVSLRLPGILARPKGPSGMKSAFLSELFHALRARERFTCPVSATGTIWAQSVARCAENLLHALRVSDSLLPPGRALTLPAQVITVGSLSSEIARQCGTVADLVDYRPDPALEAAFAAQPPLQTPGADRAGFTHDGDLAKLVESALATIT